MGKTQLARNYADIYRNDYSAVFWFNSKDVDTLKRSFLNTAERIEDNPSFKEIWSRIKEKRLDEGVEEVKAVREWLSMPKNTRWLLIYDNYDTPSEFQIRDFFPEAQQGAILVTTRSHGLMLGQPILVEKRLSSVDIGGRQWAKNETSLQSRRLYKKQSRLSEARGHRGPNNPDSIWLG